MSGISAISRTSRVSRIRTSYLRYISSSCCEDRMTTSRRFLAMIRRSSRYRNLRDSVSGVVPRNDASSFIVIGIRTRCEPPALFDRSSRYDARRSSTRPIVRNCVCSSTFAILPAMVESSFSSISTFARTGSDCSHRTAGSHLRSRLVQSLLTVVHDHWRRSDRPSCCPWLRYSIADRNAERTRYRPYEKCGIWYSVECSTGLHH